jgi:predicted transposase YbfD/YdcC
MPHPKKVGTLPVADTGELKQTNEIKTAIPLLDAIDIQGMDITADALLTQRAIAEYLVSERNAHYHFTVKANQATLLGDIALFFHDPRQPDFTECSAGDHGRIETTTIWTTTQLNDYLEFPHVKQAFMIKRESTDKKTGKHSCDIVFGITSRDKAQADAQLLLTINRGHWVIENSCHYILDWNYDEDRSRIRTGYGPENMSRLRRFAIGVIKLKGATNVAQKMRQLTRNVRLVFDYLRMTINSCIVARKL